MKELKLDNQIRVPSVIANARYHLPIIEQKIVWAISKYIKDDCIIEVNGDRLCEYCGFPEKEGIRYLLRHTQLLRDRSIVVETEHEYKCFGWVDSFKIDKDTHMATIRINPDIQPFYHYINQEYISGKREILMSFKKEYTPRFYELLRFSNKHEKNKTHIFSKEELLLALGIDKKSVYSRTINTFKERVIKPSIEEINEKTDMTVYDVQYIRTGRTITDIKFSWKMKEEKKKDHPDKTAKKKEITLTEEDRAPKKYAGLTYVYELSDKVKLALKKKADRDCTKCDGRGWYVMEIFAGNEEEKQHIQMSCECVKK